MIFEKERGVNILKLCNVSVFFLSMILMLLLLVNSICYQSLKYLTNVVPLILVVINLCFIHKTLKTQKNKYEFLFLFLFPLTFVFILLFLLLDIPISIVLTMKNRWYQPFYLYNNISILLILVVIILIFVNWNFVFKNKNESRYIQLFKDIYSIFTLITTLVVAILNLGFDKGNQLNAITEFNIISIPLVGYLVCSFLEFIYKHALTIKDIKNKLKGH